MNYIALYRKYRPNGFDRVIGQTEIKVALQNAISNNSFSHAYLFSGPRGTGKTSIAKIFAKSINCENLANGAACNNCSNCLEMNQGLAVDVLEIDAASNNGVDEIREIRNNVQLSPTKAKYKVYIIDEIHMLTNSAFNALLKTLEEPPKHVIFILATTESHKIPATIISRCQQYNFRKISKNELEHNLINILNREQIKFEELAIKEIALLSDGSARDSLSILEQVVMFSNRNVTLEAVNTIFATVSKQNKLAILKNIFENNANEVLETSKKLYFAGTDFELLSISLLDILKEIFEFKQTNNLNFLTTLSKNEAEIFANKLTSQELVNLIDLLTDNLNKMKLAKSQELYFELILLKALSFFENNKKDLTELVLSDGIKDVKMEQPEIKEQNIYPENNENIEIYSDNTINQNQGPVQNELFTTEQQESENRNNVKIEQDDIPMEGLFENSFIAPADPDQFFANDENVQPEISTSENENNIRNAELNQTNSGFENNIVGITNLDKYRDDIKKRINIYSLTDINYSVNQILNILVAANKENRQKFETFFNELIKTKDKKINFEKLISFYGVKYAAGSDQGLIIVTSTKPEANWISHEMSDWEFRNKLFEYFDSDFVIIALSENEWSNIKGDYLKLRQANKLPTVTLVDVEEFYQNLLIKQIDDYESHKEAIETGKQIFDNIKIID
ncbi:DNA polymerase III subunits gamma and tau [Spiroplasma syrphidicola EA-1]|uniref:DNA polymerase III subunit gamma/tau n=1 Tax=Spiroplasma syrphidicola EA-1 TaxID=1276229 RepID=R4U4W8_9MOLU|nr:DNA polymerase III subunit gamma/tau [Spiroplasma syrphidicola]AGM25603.1 DNA polymerase III subunits gamma and tau [Spiroplasma syrphidicola EA-1]